MGGDAHPNERRLVAKVSHARKSSGCSAERTGREEERKDRLRTERRLGVWHGRRLESDGIGGKGVG